MHVVQSHCFFTMINKDLLSTKKKGKKNPMLPHTGRKEIQGKEVGYLLCTVIYETELINILACSQGAHSLVEKTDTNILL